MPPLHFCPSSAQVIRTALGGRCDSLPAPVRRSRGGQQGAARATSRGAAPRRPRPPPQDPVAAGARRAQRRRRPPVVKRGFPPPHFPPSLVARPLLLSVPEPKARRAFSPPSRHSRTQHQSCHRPGSKGRAGRRERASAPEGRSTRGRSAEELGPVRGDCTSGARRARGRARSLASERSPDPASQEVSGAPAPSAGTCRTASSTPG